MSDQHSQAQHNLPDHRGQLAEPGALATQAEAPSKPKSRSMVREVIETLLLALIIFLAVRAVVLNFRVDGHSMDHSLETGEMLLVNRNAYFALDQEQWLDWLPGVDFDEGDTWRPFGTPERGDIVVLNPPDGASADKPYIKRVIGLPGDTIEIHDDRVFVNGVPLEEEYVDDGNRSICYPNNQHCGPIEIPEGQVFVMGDNRQNSEDSRTFGLVPLENIIGKAWITYWPGDRIGTVPHEDYPEIDG
jgi:signal peptidase I